MRLKLTDLGRRMFGFGGVDFDTADEPASARRMTETQRARRKRRRKMARDSRRINRGSRRSQRR